MRRPNLKWLVKSLCLLLVSGTIFLLITSWIAASPYNNKVSSIVHSENEKRLPENNALPHKQQPNAQPQRQQQALPIEPPESDIRRNVVDLDDNDIVDSRERDKEQIQQQHQQEQQLEAQPPMQLLPPAETKKDWHDYTAMERDAKRVGIGEQGKKAKLPDDEKQTVLERKMSLENGFNALLSDSISVNRSLPDIRYVGCRKKLYLAKLPTVSVVIPFHNEHLGVLMRSVHSLINRSPAELLKEIILVDDKSDREYLFKQLEDYIAEHFPRIVQVVRLSERTGLIGARMAGARKATAEVLIFLDSHIEANYNWLPPLLEPIAINKRTSVCPFIDVIDHSNFEYRAQDEGARGAFDWQFYYKRLALLPEDLLDRTKPFKSPIMAGGLFAISREFFFELGGYDEGLDIWGGEQYELSFKIWMCGGELLDAPCSRVGHIYRGPRENQPSARKGDYLHKNYKRVAEVWMDEYKQYLYEHDQGIYDNIDAGDLSKQKAIREKLHCKSFKWFMDNVAFDLIKTYPPVEPPDYAHGAIQNVGDSLYCIDTLGRSRHNEIGIYPCAPDLERPQRNQNWALSWHRDLRLRHKTDCLDVQQSPPDATVWLWDCHGQGGNQFWYYNREKQWLIPGRNGKNCLEANTLKRSLVVNVCDENNKYMKWKFGFVNATALETFFDEPPN